MRSVVWSPGLKKYLATFEYHQELVGLIRGTACSQECDAAVLPAINSCADDTPFYSNGCTNCAVVGARLANGFCPPPASGEYNFPDTDFAFTGSIDSNAQVQVIQANSPNTQEVTPLVGVAIQDQKLVPLRDQKNPTSHIIGALLAGAAVASFYCCCLLAFCWRRKKKEEEKRQAEEESKMFVKPIWMAGSGELSDDEDGSMALQKGEKSFSKSSQR